jgi:hypothetical protein
MKTKLTIGLAVAAIVAIAGYALSQKNSGLLQAGLEPTASTTQPFEENEAVQEAKKETKPVAPTSTYRNSALGYSFSYSSYWHLEEVTENNPIALTHTESPETGSDVPGKGNSKIEISITDDSFLSYGNMSTTTVAGRTAYKGVGVGGAQAATYYVALPSQPGNYLAFDLYGSAPKSSLDEVVKSLRWE